MKIVKVKSNVTVILNDGTMLTSGNCTNEMYREITRDGVTDNEVKCIMIPEFYKKQEEVTLKTKMMEDFRSSDYLTVKGASIYLEDVSQLSLPEDLALAIFKAEQSGDAELLQTYINFWTLASLNPDSRARTNLFWFLKRYGMTISRSGLFVAYRNVVLKSEGSDISSKLAKAISKLYVKVKFKWKKSPKNYFVVYDGKEYGLVHNDEEVPESYIGITELGNLYKLYLSLADDTKSPVYTDAYSQSFTIKIGEPVIMPRSECDSKQENTCSRGLHVAGKDWLQNNYFGKESLIVLVNPADVVAVPPEDSYGKMRTCAYYPVALVERDEDGDIINDNVPDGFEDDFFDLIAFTGNINNNEESTYTVEIPNMPEINRNRIYDQLGYIAEQIRNKYDVD